MPLVVSRVAALLALIATFLVPTVALASSHDACAMPQSQCASLRDIADCCCHSVGGANAPSTPAVDPTAQAAAAPFELAAHETPFGCEIAARTVCVIPPSPPRAGLLDRSTLFSTLLI